jgi:hypothetical protein
MHVNSFLFGPGFPCVKGVTDLIPGSFFVWAIRGLPVSGGRSPSNNVGQNLQGIFSMIFPPPPICGRKQVILRRVIPSRYRLPPFSRCPGNLESNFTPERPVGEVFFDPQRVGLWRNGGVILANFSLPPENFIKRMNEGFHLFS